MGQTSPLLQQHSGDRMVMVILPPPQLESTWGCFYPVFKIPLAVLLGAQSWHSALTQAELCPPGRAAPGPPGCCE